MARRTFPPEDAEKKTVAHHHGHGHGHAHAEEDDRRLGAAVALNLVLTAAQVIGGLLSGSLMLIADALHNLSDAASLLIAVIARRIARRPADAGMTFGYARAETVAALINYTTLILIGLYLGMEAVGRLFDPQPIEGWTVVIVAGVALAVDAATAALTWRGAKGSLNIRAAFLHNLADALTSVAVILGGATALLYDWRLVDPIVTLAISAYVIWHGGSEIGAAIRLLMLGAPESPRLDEVAAAMRAVEGARDVHHLHLWRLDERRLSLEAHVDVEDASPATARRAKAAIREALAARFGLRHVTLETEFPGEACQSAGADLAAARSRSQT